MTGTESTDDTQRTPLPPRSLAARLGITSVPRDELKQRYMQSGSKFVQIMGADVHYVDEGRG